MTFEGLCDVLRVELNNAANGRGMIGMKFSNTLELANGKLAKITLTLRGRRISIAVGTPQKED